MAINPKLLIFNYQISGKNVLFGRVFLKPAAAIFLVPLSQFWRHSTSLDAKRQLVKNPPVTSLYLEIIWKFLTVKVI